MGDIVGIVLAGGRSSRMGENKALLDFNGAPLVGHMMDLLRQSGLDDIHISGELEGYGNCSPDQDNGDFSGPAAAICGIIKALGQYDGFLIVPVDMPFLTVEILQELMSHDDGAHYEGWPIPLYLPSSVKFDETQKSVKGLIAAGGIKALHLPDEGQQSFINMNTPEQWNKVVQR